MKILEEVVPYVIICRRGRGFQVGKDPGVESCDISTKSHIQIQRVPRLYAHFLIASASCEIRTTAGSMPQVSLLYYRLKLPK